MEQQKNVENINTNFVFLHLKSKTLRRLLTHDGTKIGVYSFPSVQEIQLLCVRCHDTGSMIKQKVGGKNLNPKKYFKMWRKEIWKILISLVTLSFYMLIIWNGKQIAGQVACIIFSQWQNGRTERTIFTMCEIPDFL